ncbi:MAG: SpoIIE family protein phosphatase [Planctomycetes bacterium]|nr:SpoIIE family protein phosphatase [Planctomycetota bacterium]MBI3845074.1 SpoIIE family protein phosphatase [Planctomycetota bacterium]
MSVNSEVDLDKLLPFVVDRAVEFTKTERGILLMPDAKGDLIPAVARDVSRRNLPPGVKFSRSISTAVAKTGQALQRVISGEDEPADLATSMLELKLRSVMCAPLVLHGRTLGVIYVDSRAASREFTETDVQMFEILGQHLANAIEKARLVREEVEKQRMQVSLGVARDIQKHFLSHKEGSVDGFDVAIRSWSCDETNGDYCDILPLRSGRVAIAVGDVSGHGIGPALLMSAARARLRTLLRYCAEIEEVLPRLNEGLEEDMEAGRFLTLFYGELEKSTNTLAYASAGHPPAVLVRAAGGAIEDLGKTGPALGFSTDSIYTLRRGIRMERGDLLVVYTDGLVEAMNAERTPFGIDNVKEILKSHRGDKADAVLERLGAEVTKFAGPTRQDDMTLVAIKASE